MDTTSVLLWFIIGMQHRIWVHIVQKAWKTIERIGYHQLPIANNYTMLQKRSKCEVDAWLCWSMIILLPLRFYAKSILVILKPSKLPFWPFEQLWILNFSVLLTFASATFFQKSKFKASKIVQSAVFDLLKSAKIDCT